MRISYPSWGSVLTTFLAVTSFSSVNTSRIHNDVHRHHDQLHRDLPAGSANSFMSGTHLDSNGQELDDTFLLAGASAPKSSMIGNLHTPKPYHSANKHWNSIESGEMADPRISAQSWPSRVHALEKVPQQDVEPHASELKPRAVSDESGCPSSNGTIFQSAAGVSYQTICNINMPGQDLPFQLVTNFTECVAACDFINIQASQNRCLAALFTPNRVTYANDCYLKYAINQATAVPTTLVEGAILVPSTDTPHTSSKGTTSLSPKSTIKYASGTLVIKPAVASSKLHGPTQNYPASQYIHHVSPPDLTLAKNLLTVGIEGDVSIDYPISEDTGNLLLNETTMPFLSALTGMPHLSRDGGKGGLLNGAHMFIFCDTGSYTTNTDNTNGNFLGFTSSSVAVDTGMNALSGDPIHLEDGIGGWSDDVGRMRGFSPLTQGEQSYNLAMQGHGQRYAIWPESSIIPLNSESALLYAPIVYDNVDMTTKAATFTYTGATLLTISASNQAGPVATRTVDRLFEENEVEWGCVGGIRSWGPSGIGGNDGSVYIFGNVRGGILLARTTPDSVADRNSYQYWTGDAWSHGMQAPTSTAYFISGPFMDVDVFYSPRHLTFIIVYMTIYADSTFYYRYLLADQGILPPFAPGGDTASDYVANILKYKWSAEMPLYRTGTGLSGKYTYAGGVHTGYFGANDITNGGTKMLLSWTAPTGRDPASEVSEYQIITAEIDWE